ncbi:MAG: TetR/AcrR family transcriptional regulator [Ruminococcus sp.]|nr:TetR/AcrR family transcriptional regulator [Ruminococcus sp.]
MGKAAENKQIKLEALFKSAYDLFLSQGIAKTSIHDIVQNAGVAKGTFYLYFKDKYEVRDRLVSKTAGKLFLAAHKELQKTEISSFEDKIIFIVDYVIGKLENNKPILQFIYKNLSWGVFRQAVTRNEADSDFNGLDYFQELIQENTSLRLRSPETMLFLIMELASSACYSTILENEPVSFQELKPDLYNAIRAIIRNHVISDATT